MTSYRLYSNGPPTAVMAHVPDLPGCVALANTEETLLVEMREAIELHFARLHEDGRPVPHPSTVAATVISLDAA